MLKSQSREIAATAERNGRKCRHVCVVINPDLQAQDQPKGKQQKKIENKTKIHSLRDRFFVFLSMCYHYCDSDRISSRCQTNKFFFRVFPTRTLFIRPTCHKTRETTMSVRLWTDVRRIVMIGRFLWTHHVFVCLFVFVSSSFFLLKNNINARHGGDYIGERLCVSSWPPIFLSIFLKK